MKYIYGLGKSGRSIINYLNEINEDYFCWDDNEITRLELKKIDKNINLIKFDELNLDIIKESFVSPGIPLSDIKIKRLGDNGIKLYRDLELYSRLTKEKKNYCYYRYKWKIYNNQINK